MEQYELVMPREKKDVAALFNSLALMHAPTYLYIRQVGSHGGKVHWSGSLVGRKISCQSVPGGILIRVDEEEVFQYRTVGRFYGVCGKRWSVAYKRIGEDGVMFFGSGLEDPDDPNLPPVTHSTLRSANFEYLIEITFEGKIELEKNKEVSKKFGWPHYRIADFCPKKDKSPAAS